MNQSTTPDDLLRAPTAEEIARLHSWAQVGLQRLVDAILQPSTFLAAIVWLLGGSYIDVAVIATAAAISYALGSVIMPFALSKVTDIRLVLLGANLVRSVASAIIAIVGWQANSMDSDQIVTLLVIAVLFYQISSLANVSRNPRSFIANLDQPTSPRSRQAVGATAGLIGGAIAWRTLGNQQFTFEVAAGMLLLLAGAASLGSVWFQITAPVRYQDTHQKLPIPTMSEVEGVLQISAIRRYLGVRLLFGMATLADPFIIIYGIAAMRFNLWYLGASVLAMVAAQVVGGAIWTFFGEMPGSKRAIQAAAVLRFIALTLALSIPFFGNSRWYAENFDSHTLASWAYVAVFFLLGLAQNTYTRNEHHYAMRRIGNGALYPAVDMVLNVSLVITALTPLLGAALINATSLRTTIAIAAGIALLAVMSSAFLVARRKLAKRRRPQTDFHGPRKPVADRAPRTSRIKVRRIKR